MSEEPSENLNEKNDYESETLKNSRENYHKIRLSIDIHSLKEADFKGLIYVRYAGIPSIGVKQFKTLPAIEVLNTSEG